MSSAGWLTRDRIAEIARFSAVGLGTFGLDEGCLILLHDYGAMPLSVATGIAYTIAALVNFLISRQWVFEQASQGATPRTALIRYAVVIGVGLLLTAAAVPIMSGAGLDYKLAKMVASILVGIGNYFAFPLWVFKK